MAKKTTPPNAPPPTKLNFIPLNEAASAGAPFIYFDNAPVFAVSQGVFSVTLETSRMLVIEPAKITRERVVVAHLRMNMPACLALRNLLDSAIRAAEEPAAPDLKNTNLN